MKAFTDISQSKRLAEILPLESADMEYLLEHWIDEKTGHHKEEYYEIPVVKVDDDCPLQQITLPCWSLAALLKMLKDYQLFSNGLIVYIDNESYKIDSDNPVDNCVKMIIKLHELNLL